MYYDFNRRLPYPLRVVHPLQLAAVREFMHRPILPCVRGIILFGGSLSAACHPGSDLDIAVVVDDSADEEVRRLVRQGYKKTLRPLDLLDVICEELIKQADGLCAAGVPRDVTPMSCFGGGKAHV